MKPQTQLFIKLLAMWVVYFELVYWLLIVVWLGGNWMFVHLATLITSLLIIAVTAGSQNKDIQ